MKSYRLASTLLLLLAIEIHLPAQVTDDEIRRFYDQNPSKFAQPEMVRAGHILLSTRDIDTRAQLSDVEKKAKRKQIEDILKRARDGEDFAKLAREYSEDPGSKYKGGEYTFPRGQMVPEFEAAAFSLETNQISDVVTTPFGYHIIKLIENIPAKKVAFAKVAPDIRDYLSRGVVREESPHNAPQPKTPIPQQWGSDSQPTGSGTGFTITEDGFLITNEHVARGANQVRLVTSAGLISARVVKVDAANDLALLKAEGRFAALPVAASRGVTLGATVATVGFPNIGLQGFSPKLAKGEIASLAGAGDDARYFQISVPVQPGNSGGALVDERGNVVGVVSAKLSARAALASSGTLPENVNYAVKSSYLLSFLESVPEVSAKLKETETKARKFEDVVKSAEQAAVLVLVY